MAFYLFGWVFWWGWQQVCLTSIGLLAGDLYFPSPHIQYSCRCVFTERFIYDGKGVLMVWLFPTGLPPAVIGPRMCPLPPAGTGFTSQCCSTWRASVCICTVEVAGVDLRQNWGVPHLLCATWWRHFDQHTAMQGGGYKFAQISVLVIRTCICLACQKRHLFCHSTQVKSVSSSMTRQSRSSSAC